MKLTYVISLLVILIFLISSCANQPKQPICNKPYILVGNECCLDKDSNSICDKDEAKEDSKAEEPKKITQEKTVEETKTYTIQDLQADIGNVLGKTVVLTKDPALDYAQVYSNKISNSKFLGKYGGKPYSKLTTKKRQKVVQITDSKNYLKDKEDFQNFVTENKDLFIESALKSKEIFENEFKEELPKTIYLGKYQKDSDSTAEKTEYVNHSILSPVVYYDDVTFLETVSENLAEIDYIRVNKYEMTVDHPERWGRNGYTEKLSNINYGQSIVLHCSPNLVIGLSFEDYADGTATTYERGYDVSDVTSDYFKTSLRDHYQELIKDSQALVKMCEQRYEFTYVRER